MGSNYAPLPSDSMDWVTKTPYTFEGLDILIEYLPGETRSKLTDTGVVIAGVMPAGYGFILGTTDLHGEEIDMYLSPDHDQGMAIYILDQINPQTKQFDEHKIFLGFASLDDVVMTYLDVFSDGSGQRRLGAITTLSSSDFQVWLNSESYSLQPACKFGIQNADIRVFQGVEIPRLTKPIDEAGGVEISLPDLSRGPKLNTAMNEAGGIDYTFCFFGPLTEKRHSNLIDTFSRVLDLALPHDTMTIKIASPGGSVFLMGRMISAMTSTKAKVTTISQGVVASAAVTVWAHGHERVIKPGSYFMQHMSSQMLNGKTTDIAARAAFCMQYITKQLAPLIKLGLFTDQEVADMIEKHADIYISGREASRRIASVGVN